MTINECRVSRHSRECGPRLHAGPAPRSLGELNHPPVVLQHAHRVEKAVPGAVLQEVAGDILVIGPRPVLRRRGGSHDKDQSVPQKRITAQLAQKLNPVHARHVQIKQY